MLGHLRRRGIGAEVRVEPLAECSFRRLRGAMVNRRDRWLRRSPARPPASLPRGLLARLPQRGVCMQLNPQHLSPVWPRLGGAMVREDRVPVAGERDHAVRRLVAAPWGLRSQSTHTVAGAGAGHRVRRVCGRHHTACRNAPAGAVAISLNSGPYNLIQRRCGRVSNLQQLRWQTAASEFNLGG